MAEGQGVACRTLAPDDAAVQRVVLQPSTAWGDGGHPTTRMIIQFLNSSDLQQVSVLDYGCVGSPYNAVNMHTMSVNIRNKRLYIVQVWHRDPGTRPSLLCPAHMQIAIYVTTFQDCSVETGRVSTWRATLCHHKCVLQGITAALLGASKLVRISFCELPFCVVYCESAMEVDLSLLGITVGSVL